MWNFVEGTFDRGYKKAEIYDGISKTLARNREDLLILLTQNNELKYRIPLTLTYNRTLSNVKEVVKKHWNIWHINKAFKDVFPEPPIMSFRRNKKLKGFLWSKTIVNKKDQKVKWSNRKGYSIPCCSKTGNLCCKKVKHTNTFSSAVTKKTYNIYNKKTYNIYNKLNCQSIYLTYLVECTLCKQQYPGNLD